MRGLINEMQNASTYGMIILQVKAVVVTYDEHFSYSKLIKACSYAKNPNNLFVATNEDPSMPSKNKEIVLPGKCWGRGPLFR